jgi:hypothetical protein
MTTKCRLGKKAKPDGTWKRIKWDGNPSLKLECWRKNFRNGHVSVGIGEFLIICYSYGANSDFSLSGTRWRKTGIMSERQATKIVDRNDGRYNHKDNEPK